jgi:hypothetical protein
MFRGNAHSVSIYSEICEMQPCEILTFCKIRTLLLVPNFFFQCYYLLYTFKQEHL